MDYDFITTCNWTQTGTFTLRAYRGSSTNVVTSYTLYYRKKGDPTWTSTSDGTINITSTGEWEVANDWNKSGNDVLTHSYYGITTIDECTDVYMDSSKFSNSGTTVGNYFLNYCWYGCSNLISMPVGFNIPSGITTVGNYFLNSCWESCSSLESMPSGFNIPSGITTVGNYFLYYCWDGCSSLESMPEGFNIPSGITSVGSNFLNYCWYGCSNLTSMPVGFNIPSGITSVGSSFLNFCWYGCSNLTSMPVGFNIPSGITSVGSNFLNFCWFGCSNLESMPSGFNIPSSSTTVGDFFLYFCWHNCSKLKQDGYTEDLVFEFDASNVFSGSCPVRPQSVTGASKEEPVIIPVNRLKPSSERGLFTEGEPSERYWVGGSGVWSSSDTSHWSTSSGGVGGASVPTYQNNVYIDSNSGFASGGTISVRYGHCKDFICTSGHTYTIQENDYGSVYIDGSLELESGITWSSSLGVVFNGSGTIKTNGVKLNYVHIGTLLA